MEIAYGQSLRSKFAYGEMSISKMARSHAGLLASLDEELLPPEFSS